MKFRNRNNLTFFPIIWDIIVVKVFSTNTDISFIKKNLSYSVIFLHPKLKQCLGLCSQGRRTIEKSYKDFSTYEMFITKVFTEDQLSFVSWLLQTSVWFSWALTNGSEIGLGNAWYSCAYQEDFNSWVPTMSVCKRKVIADLST